MTKSKPETPQKRKRHIILSILLIIWTIIKTVFITYAVLFTLAATFLIFKGYQYFNDTLMKPVNEVKSLMTENPAESAYMSRYRQELREKKENDSLTIKFVPLDSISKTLIYAVLAVEDDGFYNHPGFSLDAIVEAIEYNKTAAANKQHGASTITQQLAKNLFLTSEKSFERKVKELGYTLLMEKYLGKDRILELYMNYAQWGKNIFGCEAAANIYYKKTCMNLSMMEAARMAACLSMPSKITPLHTKSVYMGKRVMIIANNMYLRKRIDDAGYLALTGVYPPGRDGETDGEE
ncbi:MAG: monofunctional biosynthetic peptidoglycan transglycosylase [Chitinispirillales bacterium]|jgi:monofunctional biosynthetic peptidoglycan transglycosylase|nr:monofunctional biosynthetic peptidoglycan transglycosylase [Chitinispirillales bacterium]